MRAYTLLAHPHGCASVSAHQPRHNIMPYKGTIGGLKVSCISGGFLAMPYL